MAKKIDINKIRSYSFSDRGLRLDSYGNVADWFQTQSIDGVIGKASYSVLNPIDGDNPVFHRLNYSEVEVDTLSSTSDYSASAHAFDIHLDRTGSGGDYLANLTNVSLNTSVEGTGQVGNIFGIIKLYS